MMESWDERPSDVAHLLNPAFCGEIIRSCIEGYSAESENGMPFINSFLILPMILSEPIRNSLPKTTRKTMAAWLEENPELRITFAARARDLVPFTKESLSFLLQNDMIHFGMRDSLLLNRPVTKAQLEARKSISNGEVADCYKKAFLVGRLLSKVNSSTTLFTMWGVSP